jgi:hypothetical protein
MTTGTKQLKLGKLLFLGLVFLSSCRTDPPPKLSIICIGDGLGGAECADSFGNSVYRLPSQLKNFWMTTEADEANFASWCYEGTPNAAPSPSPAVLQAMEDIKKQIYTR